MATFGETLKRERELRKISLREVSEATKIGLRYLEALEANRFDRLPGGLFNKGFIRAYAKFIGLDGEAMVNAYLFDLNSQQNPPPGRPRYAGFSIEEQAPPVPPVEEPASPRPRRRWAVAGIVGAGVVVVAAILWLVAFRGPSSPTARGPSPPASVEKAQILPDSAEKVPPPAVEEGEKEEEEKAQIIPETPEQSSPAAAGDEEEVQAAADVAAQVPSPAIVEEQVTQARAEEPLSLTVSVSETTWIAVVCDGVERLSREIAAGDSVHLSCRNEIHLYSGNAGTMMMQINGHDCVPLGERGEVIRNFVLDRARALELCPPPSREP